MTRVFIDGSAGTTGLRIADRLAARTDISLIRLPEELRKRTDARKDAINSADIVFLCLPDDKAEQTAVLATLQACMAAGRQDVTFFVVMGVCPMQANPGADAATLCNYAQIAGVTTDSGYLHRFESTMLNELKEQQQLLGELERALDNHEFCFFLQPKCNSITRAIVGMEALVRWNHPTRGCVPPAEFMPLLERTGLVTRLDQYIWESVCQTLQKWQESGSNLVPVSVNVSVQDILNLDVPQVFADLVEKYKLEPKRMQLVYPYIDKEPNMVLLEATRGGKPRMTVEKPLIVYQSPGVYMPEIYDIYGY